MSMKNALLRNMRFELIPLKSTLECLGQLPEGITTTVSCSLKKGIESTQELTEVLISRGHPTVPHIVARQIDGPKHSKELVEWLRRNRISEVLVVGGDVSTPRYYPDSLSFMRDLLELDTDLKVINFAAHPEGHNNAGPKTLHEILLAKQELLRQAGVKGVGVSQLCFDADSLIRWLRGERDTGFEAPLMVGIAGVVGVHKLVEIGFKLGIGNSLHMLGKMNSSLQPLLMTSGYDPSDFLDKIVPEAKRLNIVGIHSCTFNCVASTAQWRQKHVHDID